MKKYRVEAEQIAYQAFLDFDGAQRQHLFDNIVKAKGKQNRSYHFFTQKYKEGQPSPAKVPKQHLGVLHLYHKQGIGYSKNMKIHNIDYQLFVIFTS